MRFFGKIACRWVLLLLLMGCNGEGTLLDLYPNAPLVNPEIRALIQDNRIVYARLGGQGHIMGVTDKGWFGTQTKFKSFAVEDRSWRVGDAVMGMGHGWVVFAMDAGETILLRYSGDEGKTWATYEGPEGMSITQLSVASDGAVWLLGRRRGQDGDGLRLYRIDLHEKHAELRYAKTGALGMAVGFLDGALGWLLSRVSSGATAGVRVEKTVDGGRTWIEGAQVEGEGTFSLAIVDANRLLVYDNTARIYHSTDGGMSVEPVSLAWEMGASIVACQAVSGEVVYAVTNRSTIKSTDGGRTWSLADANAYRVPIVGSALYFRDERHGIVYGPDRLFLTENGGEHWEVLVYPYDYVFE